MTEVSIPGISKFSTAGRVAAGRRLEAQEEAQESEKPFDICANGWTSSKDEVARLQQLMLKEDGKEVIQEYLKKMEIYGEEFCIYGDRKLLEQHGIQVLSYHPDPVVTLPYIM